MDAKEEKGGRGTNFLMVFDVTVVVVVVNVACLVLGSGYGLNAPPTAP